MPAVESEEASIRAFLAFEITDALREEIRRLSESLRPKLRSARFVPVENVHLTVRFLGETAPEVAKMLLARMKDDLARSEAFELRVCGVGAFPSEKRPRVLWAGVPDVPEPMFALARGVEARVVEAGFEPEPRTFRPHLTLARFKRPEKHLAEVVAPLKNRELGVLPAVALTFFESRPSSSGASYHVIERIALRTARRGPELLSP